MLGFISLKFKFFHNLFLVFLCKTDKSKTIFNHLRMRFRILCLVSVMIFSSYNNLDLKAQEADSSVVMLGSEEIPDSLFTDSTKIIEDAALDIGQDRGLFIVTPDNKMQLRILGSVRYLVVFDDMDLNSKNSLITFEIPTGENRNTLPNYYNGLTQSRLGFEITRDAPGGNVFIRLETDFAGRNGYRIRHAYGQYDKFLFGQTWSLFSSIASLPATVGFGGPTGGILVRTPQIRYTMRNLIPGSIVSLGLEYFKPDFQLPDTLAVKSFQLIPDITARIEMPVKWGTFQLSGILPIISGRSSDGDYLLRPGWGVSVSTVVSSWAGGKWYLQASGGQAIARFYHDLSGQGLDLFYDPGLQRGFLPLSWGGYLSFEQNWGEKVFSNFTYGTLFLETEDFVTGDTYFRGGNFRFNTFWSVVDGARVGAEYIRGTRMNKAGDRGMANRINLLFYYDF